MYAFLPLLEVNAAQAFQIQRFERARWQISSSVAAAILPVNKINTSEVNALSPPFGQCPQPQLHSRLTARKKAHTPCCRKPNLWSPNTCWSVEVNRTGNVKYLYQTQKIDHQESWFSLLFRTAHVISVEPSRAANIFWRKWHWRGKRWRGRLEGKSSRSQRFSTELECDPEMPHWKHINHSIQQMQSICKKIEITV